MYFNDFTAFKNEWHTPWWTQSNIERNLAFNIQHLVSIINLSEFYSMRIANHFDYSLFWLGLWRWVFVPNFRIVVGFHWRNINRKRKKSSFKTRKKWEKNSNELNSNIERTETQSKFLLLRSFLILYEKWTQNTLNSSFWKWGILLWNLYWTSKTISCWRCGVDISECKSSFNPITRTMITMLRLKVEVLFDPLS